MKRIIFILLFALLPAVFTFGQTATKKPTVKYRISPLVARFAYLWAGEIQDAEGMNYDFAFNGGDDPAASVLDEIGREMDQSGAFELHGEGDERIMDMLSTALSLARHRRFIVTQQIYYRDLTRLHGLEKTPPFDTRFTSIDCVSRVRLAVTDKAVSLHDDKCRYDSDAIRAEMNAAKVDDAEGACAQAKKELADTEKPLSESTRDFHMQFFRQELARYKNRLGASCDLSEFDSVAVPTAAPAAAPVTAPAPAESPGDVARKLKKAKQ